MNCSNGDQKEKTIKTICCCLIIIFLLIGIGSVAVFLYVQSTLTSEDVLENEVDVSEDTRKLQGDDPSKEDAEETEGNITEVEEIEDGAQGTLLVTTPVDTMSLRTTPGLGEDIIRDMPAGIVMSWNGEIISVEDRNYYKVTMEDTGETGYVTEDCCTPYQFDYDMQELTIVETNNALYTYDMMVEDIDELQSAYPDAIQSQVIGNSVDGRQLYDVTLGNPNGSFQIMVQAAIHGREYMSSQLVMKMLEYYAHYMESGTFNGVTYKELFENTAIHVVPMSNPDGVTISQLGTSALNNAYITDLLEDCYERDKETLVYEIDSNGYPNWNDKFQDEGFDREAEVYDQIISFEEYLSIWKANANGVDLNNNFEAGWSDIDLKIEEGFENFKGYTPVSEPETQALVELANREDYDAYISYHSRGQIIYYDVYGNTPETSAKSEGLANLLASYNRYNRVNTNKGYHVNLGGFSDWIQLDKNKASCTVELGKMPCPITINEFPSMWNRNRETWALLCDTLINSK